MDLFDAVLDNLVVTILFLALFALLSFAMLRVKSLNLSVKNSLFAYAGVLVGFIILFNGYFFLIIPEKEPEKIIEPMKSMKVAEKLKEKKEEIPLGKIVAVAKQAAMESNTSEQKKRKEEKPKEIKKVEPIMQEKKEENTTKTLKPKQKKIEEKKEVEIIPPKNEVLQEIPTPKKTYPWKLL